MEGAPDQKSDIEILKEELEQLDTRFDEVLRQMNKITNFPSDEYKELEFKHDNLIDELSEKATKLADLLDLLKEKNK